MRRGGPILLAIVCAFIAVPSAGAGFAVQLKVKPSYVKIGDLVRIELRTYALNGTARRLDDLTKRHLRVEAVSPEQAVVRIRLRHVTHGVWRGMYRFREAGRWQLRVGNWPRGKKAPRLFITVREQVEPPQPTTTTTTTSTTTTTTP
jgi:hypothetical protein